MKASKFYLVITSLIFTWIISNTPIRSYLKAFRNNELPQLVLVLGGDINREHVGANLAKVLKLPLTISGGSNPEYANWHIERTGLKAHQFSLDYRAKDTLTNFTSLVDDLSSAGITHALLITSADHMQRANIVGNIVAGSRGIKLTSISVPCHPRCQQESKKKKVGDLIRSIIWVITEKDLRVFNYK